MKHYVEKLKNGETVEFRPRGNSMKPKINSGELVKIRPLENGEPKKGDIVLCKVKGRYYVHLVLSVQQKLGGKIYQIGNNKKFTNGTIMRSSIFGKVVEISK
jgi:SOS-response transcriptional repressor LexA